MYSYVSYMLWIGLGGALVVAPYFGARYATLNWQEHKKGAIIAAIIIGVGIVAILSVAIYFDCRRRRNTSDGTDWHFWVPWSRKGKSQIRALATTKPQQREDCMRQDRIQQWNEEHRPSNGEESSRKDGRADDDMVDIESIAADARIPEKPPPVYSAVQGGQTQKDPNPTSLLNV